ncbi:GreA/GreB family elongation factor [Patescibacteria group bacterium]|nr:GreA/GreB family elongation factor [Patescibacteria group bacterium]
MDKAIQIGSKILTEINGLVKEIIIVEPQNVDPERGKISEMSPIGSALIGHEQGDKLEIRLSSRKYFLNIIKVI